MIVEFFDFEKKIKDNLLKNVLIFNSMDEERIKNSINFIKNKYINKDLVYMNYAEFDGSTIDKETIINACETMPFMSEKKIVVVYRGDFLKGNIRDDSNGMYKFLCQYIDKIPSFCILIIYSVLENKRDKISDKVKKLESKCCIIKDEKNRKDVHEKRIREILESKGKSIGKVELSLIASLLPNDTGIIENELEKLVSYVLDNEISKEHIITMFRKSTDDDIFDMVDKLANKEPEKGLIIFNKLIENGEKASGILFLIERQFRIMFYMKASMEDGITKQQFISKFRLNPYICEKTMRETEKFTLEGLKRDLSLCEETEKKLKSTYTSEKFEIEALIIRLGQ